jgi:hypothetical protein
MNKKLLFSNRSKQLVLIIGLFIFGFANAQSNSPNLSTLGAISIVASGGEAEGTTWTYANNVIMPNSATAVTINSSDVLAKLALGNLTIAASGINVNANVNFATNTNGITFKASGNIVVDAAKTITTNGGDITLWSDSDNNGAGGIKIDDNATLDSRTQADRTANTNTTGGGKITLAGGLDDAGVASGVGNLTSGLTATDGYPDGYAVNSGSTITQTGIVLGTSTAATGHNSNINILSGSGDIRLHGLVTNNSSNTTNGPTGLLFYHGYNINAGTTGNVTLLGNANLTAGAWALGLDFAAWRSSSYTANGTVLTGNGNINVIGRSAGGTSGNLSIAIDGDGNNRNIFAATGTGSVTLNGLATGSTPLDVRLTNVDLLAASGNISVIAEGTSGTKIGDYNIGNGLYLGQKAGSLVTTSTSNILIKSNNLSSVNKPITYTTTGTVSLEPFGTTYGSAQTISNSTFANTVSALTIGKATNTAGITLSSAATIAGPVNIYAGAITIDGNLNTSTGNANGDILLKGTGNIIQNASKTITTNGGDVIFWSDADGNNDGMIRLSSNVTTNGGHLWMGGGNGSAAWNGLSVGNGFATGNATNSNGLFMNESTLTTAGGNIAIYAKSRAGNAVSDVTTNANGVRFWGGNTINSGTGTIYIKGYGQGTSGSSNGIEFSGGTADLITSANTTSDAIILDGETVANPASVADGWGIYGWSATIQATADGGGVTLIGKGSEHNGVTIPATAAVLAKSGPIKLIGSGFGTGYHSVEIAGVVGAKTGTGVTVSSSNVEITGNTFKGSSGSIVSSGQLLFESFGNSFSAAFSLSNLTLSNALTGLTIGKSTNTSNITIGSTTTIAGPINVFGSALAINAPLTATNNTVNLFASGAVTQTGAITSNGLGLNGTGTFTLTNSANNFVTVAGGNTTTKLSSLSLTDASSGLTIGTVGSESGITASGLISVETLSGNLTLSQNISTTNTTSNAIILNAGKSSAIGTTTGGDILVTGTPTITVGTGGTAKLFSGSSTASTGLSTLVGGTANTRLDADETTTTFNPVLSAGTYALYRQSSAVAPVISSFSPTTAGNGETVVITGTGFTGVSIVKFGNVNATSFTVDSDTQITAVVGAAASGSVLVQNIAGNDTEVGFLFKVLELKFEGNTLDQTAANRDGTVVGAATYSPGASGQAICFTNNNVVNGTTVQNYLTLPDGLISARGSNFTISLRFKTSSYGAILGYQNAAVGANSSQWVPILYVQSDGKLNANLWQGSVLNVTSTTRVDDGNWHKVEFSAAPGSITVYIDGVLAGTSSGTIDHLSMTSNQLGAVKTTGVWTGDPIDGWFGFNGCIDEFIIIDKSLTASQIQQVTALPQPTIINYTPNSASVGQTVTVNGTNLSGATTIKIGGVLVTNFTVNSANQITFVVPNGAIPANATIEITTAAAIVNAPGFTFTNSIPTISTISDQVLCSTGTAAPVNFNIADIETPVANLSLTVTSSNAALLPVSNISFTGTTGSRTMNYTTVAGVLGTSTVTITVTDASGSVATSTFNVEVAQDRIVTSSTIPTLQARTASVIDNQITVTNPTAIDGALVIISSGFVSGDTLSYTGTLPTGVTKSYNNTSGVLTFSGSLSAAELQAIYREVKFNSTSNSAQNRTITFTLGSALPFSTNNHFYQFITVPGISWSAAKTAAEQLTFFGKQGYLATVTSAAENQFIVSKIQGQGWMGAADSQTEDNWKWMTGPEAGTQFWQGRSNGSVVGGLYNNWSTGEPNDYGSGEDYAHFLLDGKWNDFPLSSNGIQGYIVEFGGLSNDPCVVISATKTVTVVPGTTIAPVLNSPAANTTVATTFQINYTLTEAPLAGSVRLTFTPTAGGTPIVWTMNNDTSANFAYEIGSNPVITSSSNVTSGGTLPIATYNITLSYQNAFANSAASVTNSNIQTLALPNITLSQSNYTGVINSDLTAITPQNTGGTATFTISPALPNGLSINAVTGEISGRPTGTLAATSFTITATNAAGTDTVSFSLIIDQDSDGDGILNATDSDDDNDGLLDYQEQDCSASTSVSQSLTPTTFYFVQWNSFTNGVLRGVINVPGNPVNVTVTNTSNSILQQNDAPYGGVSKWSPQPSGNANLSTFRSNTLGEHKFVFDQPVNNPRFFINSLNKTLDLSLPGKVLNSNGFFTGAPVGTTTQVLVGNEGTGTISFTGNVTEISFTGRESEFYCNFSLGIAGTVDANACADIDSDGDGTPNRLDLESDGDGVLDATEKADSTDEKDSCKFVLAHQTVTTSTAWNTADCDNDGVTNADELTDVTDPLNADTDGDGVIDGTEKTDETDAKDGCKFVIAHQTVPTSTSWNAIDCDGDGTTNRQEILNNTDPLVGDTDGDGVLDPQETIDGTSRTLSLIHI